MAPAMLSVSFFPVSSLTNENKYLFWSLNLFVFYLSEHRALSWWLVSLVSKKWCAMLCQLKFERKRALSTAHATIILHALFQIQLKYIIHERENFKRKENWWFANVWCPIKWNLHLRFTSKIQWAHTPKCETNFLPTTENVW